MKLRRSLFALAILILPVAACQLLVGIEDHDFVTPDGATVIYTDAGAPDAVEAAPPYCIHSVVPPKSLGIADGPDLPDIVFVLHTATLRGRNVAGDVVGFDIDGVCTCDPTDHSMGDGGTSCVPPPNPTHPGDCDEDGGIDNAIAYAFDTFSKFPGFIASDQGINAAVACGHQSILYVLSNYNGQANDPDIAITAYESVGIHAAHDGGEAPADLTKCSQTEAGVAAGGSYPAKNDGTDEWSPSSASAGTLVGGHVRDFRLVLDGRPSVTQSGTVLPLIFGSKVVSIGTPIFVAQLVPLAADGSVLPIDSAGKILSADGKASSFRLDNGVVAGRASARDILSAAGTVKVGGTGEAGSNTELCNQIPLYCVLKGVVCSSVDTMKLPALDFKGVSCDALSMVLQFDALPARLGAKRDPDPPVEGGCAQQFADECGDGGLNLCH